MTYVAVFASACTKLRRTHLSTGIFSTDHANSNALCFFYSFSVVTLKDVRDRPAKMGRLLPLLRKKVPLTGHGLTRQNLITQEKPSGEKLSGVASDEICKVEPGSRNV